MDRILIILRKENRSRASSALTLGLNTIILKHVYWYTYMQQISGERLQDHWSSGTSHSGKRTCVTQLYMAGVDEQEIMQRTGHRSEKSVQKYKVALSEI